LNDDECFDYNVMVCEYDNEDIFLVTRLIIQGQGYKLEEKSYFTEDGPNILGLGTTVNS
jgi:hypothetical protein